MELKLVTPAGTKFDQKVYEVILPTTSGEISIFPGHEPLVTLLEVGVLKIRRQASDQEFEYLAVEKGLAEINGQMIRILTDEAAASDEILEAEAKKALELAEKMRQSAKTQVELEAARKLLARQATRLKVSELARRRHRERKNIAR